MVRIVAVLCLCAPLLAHAAPSVLRVGNGAEPEALDPQKAQTNTAVSIVRDLYEGLTAASPHGEAVAGAATSWAVSPDGLEYLFHLRPEARWSNGDPLAAEDFVAGLRRAVDPATGSAYAAVLAPIANAQPIIAGELPADRLGVDAIDAHTLRIRLHGPTPYLPGLLTLPVAFPIHRASLQQYGAQFARAGRLVSNGAYRLDEWLVQSHVKLARNPHYWNDAATQIDEVDYFPTEDRNSELKRYRAGELDITYKIPSVQAQWLRATFAGELHAATFLDTYYIGFNCTQPPFRDQLKLRQALAMVLDRETIVRKVLHGLGRAADGWVPDAVADHAPQAPAWARAPLLQRVERARRLYAEAGYSESNPLEIELRYATDPNDKRVATVVAAMWKQALGVRARLANEEVKVLISELKLHHGAQAFFWDWVGDYDDASTFTDVLQSARRQNYPGWRDEAYDALLAQASLEPRPERRRALLEQAERRMLDEAPLTPLYFNVSTHLVKPYVAGWEDNVLDYHYSKDLRILPH